MNRNLYLDRQKGRILYRLKRCEKIARSSRLDAKLKRDHLVPNQKRAIFLINNGAYGICINCKGRIDPDRLETMPAAIRCIECQRIHDNKQPSRYM